MKCAFDGVFCRRVSCESLLPVRFPSLPVRSFRDQLTNTVQFRGLRRCGAPVMQFRHSGRLKPFAPAVSGQTCSMHNLFFIIRSYNILSAYEKSATPLDSFLQGISPKFHASDYDRLTPGFKLASGSGYPLGYGMLNAVCIGGGYRAVWPVRLRKSRCPFAPVLVKLPNVIDNA